MSNSRIVIKQPEELPQNEEYNKFLIEKWLKKNKPSVRFKDEKDLAWTTEQKIKVETKQSVGGSYYRGS